MKSPPYGNHLAQDDLEMKLLSQFEALNMKECLLNVNERAYKGCKPDPAENIPLAPF